MQGQEAWSCGTVDSVSLGQALGAIQLLKPVSRLCGLHWELGQSSVWGEACGKQAESKHRCSVACSELMSAFWLNCSQVSTPEVYSLGYISSSTAGSHSLDHLACAGKTLRGCSLHWDEDPLTGLVYLIQGESLNAKGQDLFLSS